MLLEDMEMKDVVEFLIEYEVISKEVGNLMIVSNYEESILTDDDMQLTEFIKDLVRVTAYELIENVDNEGNVVYHLI